MSAKHTPNHIDCPACAEFVDAELGERIQPDWPFDRAAAFWLKARVGLHKDKTLDSNQQEVKLLGRFFGTMPLRSITIANIRAFQRTRQESAGASRINHELSALQMILKEAGCWTTLGLLYKPLPTPAEKTRQNMSLEQEQQLIQAALDPQFAKQLCAGHCLVIMANTTMGFQELRHVRRMDVRFDARYPTVSVAWDAGGCKNRGRVRDIPLNLRALKSFRWLVERWAKIGGAAPEHYLLPGRSRNGTRDGYDMLRPQGAIQKASRLIFERAGLPHLDIYDMRSHTITALLSDPSVPIQAVKEIAGHVSQRMTDRYSVQRKETKQKAMDALNRGGMMEQGAYESERFKSSF